MSMSIHGAPGNTIFTPPQSVGEPAQATSHDLKVSHEVPLQQLARPDEGVGHAAPHKNLAKPEPSAAGSTTIANSNAVDERQLSTDISALYVLFQKMAQQARDTGRTMRTTETLNRTQVDLAAAERMKEAAHSRFTGAIIQNSVQIGTGALQMGLSAYSAKNTIEGANLNAKGENVKAGATLKLEDIDFDLTGDDIIAKASIATAIGTKFNSYSTTVGGIATGAGGVATAFQTAEADAADARRAELDAQSKRHDASIQEANDTMQHMMDVIRDVRAKLESMEQAQTGINRDIARNL